MRRGSIAAAVLAGWTLAGAAGGPDVAEILRLHAAARGGADRWRALTSIEITGTQTTFSTPGPFRLIKARPNRCRFEQTVLKRPVVEAFDGTVSWWIQPLMGNAWPLAAPLPAARTIAREAEFDTPLLAPRETGHTVALAGLQDLDGQPAWKLDVTLKDGGKETWYLDPNSYLELARFSTTTDFGEEMEKRSYFSDFREQGGLKLPHRIEMEFGQRNEILEIQTVRANVAVDPAVFRLPPPEGMGALAPMAGDWEVKVETRPHPRAPWEAKSATATIASLLDGGLLEERFVQQDQGLASEVVRGWSYDRFRKVYRITHADDFSFHVNVLEGTMAEGKLTAGNEKTGTTLPSDDQTIHMRLVLHDITPDAFQIDTETSTDGGSTWTTRSKSTYTRRK